MAALLHVALLTVLCWYDLPASVAIFEDQVGTWDWSRSFIGTVNNVAFSAGGQRKRAFVSTESNVLAALNLRTGDVAWKHKFSDDDELGGLALLGKQHLITLSNHGRHVRAWGAADGLLLWEQNTYVPSAAPINGGVEMLLLNLDYDADDFNDICVLARGVLQLRSGADGLLLWSVNITEKLEGGVYEGGELYAMQLSSIKGRIDVVGVTETRQAALVLNVELESGQIKDTAAVAHSTPLGTSVLAITTETGSAWVGISAKGDTLLKLNLGTIPLKGSLETTEISQIVTKLQALGGDLLLAETHTGSKTLYRVSPTGVMPLRSNMGASEVLSSWLGLSAAKEAPAVFAAVEATSSGAVIKVSDYREEKELAAETVASLDFMKHGGPQAAFLNSFTKKDGTPGFRVLLVMRDASLFLLQQGEVVWQREESLASIKSVQYVDLPPAGDLVETEKGPADKVQHVMQRLESQLLQLKVRMKLATPEESAQLVQQRRSHAEKLQMVWDTNGFRQLIIVLTESGTLAALHNGDGRTVWSTYLGTHGTPHTMLPFSTVGAEHIPPELLLLGPGSISGTTRAVRVECWHGTVIESEELPFVVTQVLQLPVSDSDGRKLVLLVDENKNVHLYMPTEEAVDIVFDILATVYFYETDYANNTIRGYAMPAAEVGMKSWQAVQTWELPFSEELQTVVTRRREEKAHTHMRVLGDRSALFKYINMNTIFAATTTPAEVIADGQEGALTAYIIDAVTGKVLYRVRHLGADGPVHAVMCENWVVYHYWSVHAHRHEMSVLEVFDDDAAKRAPGIIEAAVLGLVGRTEELRAKQISSHALPAVRVLGQSYFFSMGVKTIAVTATSRGITSKNILLGTHTDQVLALEKRLLDPRRPTRPTVTDKEEGLIPYNPNLPIIPQQFITANQQVSGLRGIATTPARLESSSLVFAYGVDIFYTRVMPSKMYDTLDDHEFSYALLLLTIVSLAVGTIVAGVMVQQKSLQEKWR